LNPPVRLTRKRNHDLELEMSHPGVSLQLRVKGCRKQGEGGDELEPGAPLTVMERLEWNKLTLQVLLANNLKLQLGRRFA
jgi:hypothetical protein